MIRRVGCLLAAMIFSSSCVPALADSFPTRPIRIVSPFAAGSVSDVSLRVMGERLGARLGTQILVENQPTAGGISAARAVTTAAPDGYTLALLSNATAVSVALFKKLPYDPLTDFVPVSGMSDFAYVFVTNPKSPLKTLQDVIAVSRAKPGSLNFGTSAPGSSPNLTALLFRKAAGIDFTIVPFRGGPDLVMALMRNDLDVVIESYGAVKQSIADGQLRAIATTTANRAKALPDVPTVAESGIANFAVASWNGIFAPAATPPDVVERLRHEMQLVLAEPQIVERFAQFGVEVRPSSPQEISARMRDEIQRWTRVIDDAGIERQ